MPGYAVPGYASPYAGAPVGTAPPGTAYPGAGPSYPGAGPFSPAATLMMPGSASKRRRTPKALLLTLCGLAIGVVVYFGVTAILANNGLYGIPGGAGTATITWHPITTATTGGTSSTSPFTPARSSSQPFSGTIAGLPLNGAAAPPSTLFKGSGSGGTPHLPATFALAHWTGTLGGTRFDITDTLPTAQIFGAAATKVTSVTFHATGTFGAEPVRATGTVTKSRPNQLAIAGTVGNLSFHGTVHIPKQDSGKTRSVTASFTVTP